MQWAKIQNKKTVLGPKITKTVLGIACSNKRTHCSVAYMCCVVLCCVMSFSLSLSLSLSLTVSNGSHPLSLSYSIHIIYKLSEILSHSLTCFFHLLFLFHTSLQNSFFFLFPFLIFKY